MQYLKTIAVEAVVTNRQVWQSEVGIYITEYWSFYLSSKVVLLSRHMTSFQRRLDVL